MNRTESDEKRPWLETISMTSLLILTVGTGTSTTGKHSDVASGLARTIGLCTPRLFWLVPSASEKSRPVADLIRESVGCPGAFRPWSAEEPFRTIADPDDIHQCRTVLREVIAEARQQLKPGELSRAIVPSRIRGQHCSPNMLGQKDAVRHEV
jgi:hypothetical protein